MKIYTKQMRAGARLWALMALLAATPFFAAHAQALNPTGTPRAGALRLGPAPAKSSATVSNAAGGDEAANTKVLDDNYKLTIGDSISFRILEDEEDPKSLVVKDSGDLEVPYIGRYAAVGRTCKELAAALKAELEKQYYKRATVIIAVDSMTRMAGKSLGKVYLVGAVHQVGPQEMPGDETLTLSKAILRAGGFSDFADKRHVRVTRKQGPTEGDNKIYTVNVTDILEKGKTDHDLPLEQGDLIFVPDRVIRF